MRFPALLLLLSLPLAAGEEGAVGLVAGWNGPVGEFKDHQYLGTHKGSGIHGGVQFRGAINDSSDIRVQLVFLHFGGAKWEGVGQTNSYEVRQVAVDWTYGFSGAEQRFYLVAGGSVNNLHVSYQGPLSPAASRFQHGDLGLRLGGGFSFSQHLQLEGHFNQVLDKRYGSDGLGIRPLQWFQASVVLQF